MSRRNLLGAAKGPRECGVRYGCRVEVGSLAPAVELLQGGENRLEGHGGVRCIRVVMRPIIDREE